MIIKRLKLFGNLQDGFGGKKTDIVWSGRNRSDAYKKFGPWKIDIGEQAMEDFNELTKLQSTIVNKIIKELETKPYQGSYGQHPLWDYRDKTNECVVWSAEIDNENRINYLIFKYQNYILITNIGGHKVIDSEYSIRPKI